MSESGSAGGRRAATVSGSAPAGTWSCPVSGVLRARGPRNRATLEPDPHWPALAMRATPTTWSTRWQTAGLEISGSMATQRMCQPTIVSAARLHHPPSA
eukprot:3938944-Prymnesium_polylepis.1